MRYVLFVCAHSAGRSQTAQAFFERHAPADQPLEKVREIREEIERRVLALLDHADEIRSDRSAHERRLECLGPL